jgi:hypothetical protein
MTLSPLTLRKVLLLDGLTSGAMGLGLALGAGLLMEPLGLPLGLLRGAGLTLLPFAGFVLYVARRSRLHRGAALSVAAMNALWVFDSVLILLTGSVQPSALGVAFIVVQALTVAVFALLQLKGSAAQRAHVQAG